MTIDALEQFTATIRLSRQKDGVALTHALIENLRLQVSTAEVCVLEVFGSRRLTVASGELSTSEITIRRFSDFGQRLPQSELGPGIMRTIRKLTPTAVEAEELGVGRVVFPVVDKIGPLRLVVLDHVPMDPWVRTRIFQLVEIYGNLIALMDSRERDQLTGLLNRHLFVSLFELAAKRAFADDNKHLWLCVLDIDHFKDINDSYGHLYGDEVLIHFAYLMERSFRYTDDLFRFGGEEFIVLLTSESPEPPILPLERFRRIVEGHHFPGVGRQVTVSIGFAECERGALPTSIIDRADKALYHAKQNGRNKIVNHADVVSKNAEDFGKVDIFES